MSSGSTNMNLAVAQTPMDSAEASPMKLVAKGLTKRYGAVTALDNVSLALQQGEFVSLLGPSGSGKTTFLMMVAGLILPDAGELWINGKLATYLPVRNRDIGMVFQNYALFPHLTVFENIAFPMRMRKLDEKSIRAAVAEALDMVKLPHVADRLPGALSGGQQQRIALARCLVYKPSIILMDEPLGALDRKLREEMQLEIKRLHRMLGTSLLYVTHDQDEAMTMSDRICLMRDGRIEQVGSPSELYFRPQTIFSADFLGNSNFIDAEVVGSDDKRVRLKLGGGEIVQAKVNSHSPRSGKVRLMVRPERVRLGSAASHSDSNEISATIADSMLIGQVTRVYANLAGGASISATSLTGETNEVLTPGSSHTLHWSIDDTLVFPA